MSKLEKIVELSRIIKDTPYAFRTYLKTYDNTKKRFVPLELMDDQLKLINDYENYNENITKKYRQAGVSTVTAAWISKKLQLANKDNPEKILIIANKKETAVEMANKIRMFIDQWPSWMNVGFSAEKNSESRFKLNNNSEVKAVATSPDALRGYTPTILVFDEAAFIEAGEDFWGSSLASLSCVHESSYIVTDKGLVQLQDIIKEKEKIGFTPYDGEYKVYNKDFEITDIKNTFKSELADCYKITTKKGYELIGSFKHPLLVDKNGTDEWVRMDELKIMDKVKFQYNQNSFGEDKKDNFYYNYKSSRPRYLCTQSLEDDLDLCYFVGLFLNNHCYFNRKNLVLHYKGNKESIKQFLFDNHFQYKSEKFIRAHSLLSYYLKTKLDFNFLNKISKYLPKKLMTSSKKVVHQVVKGIFDFNDEKYRFDTYSRKLAQDLQILLANLGFVSEIFIGINRKKLYQLEIHESSRKDFDFFIENGYHTNEEKYFYDNVVKIEKFQDYTYDLEVPNGNSFITNGFISHNTGGKIILISCVVDDTYVFTDNGLQQVSDFVIKEKENYYGVKPYNILGKDKLRNSSIIFNNGFSDTLKLITDYTTIEGTPNHIMWCKSKNKIGWKKLKEIKKGDYLNLQLNYNLYGNNDYIKFRESEINVSSELAYLFGLLITNGYEKGNFIYLKVNENILEILEKLDINYKKFKTHIKINKKNIKELLDNLNINFNNRIIPKELLKFSYEKLNFLIKGVCELNYINEYTLKFDNQEIVNQLRMLFINIGVLTKIKTKNNKYYLIFDKISNDESVWVKVKSIQESKNYTYDFSLFNDKDDEWCHSIVYNGLLGHQTPNGMDKIYYGVYDQAIRGLNDFHITDLRWFNDTRYNKDLRWLKVDDMVHYMLNRSMYNDDEITYKPKEGENLSNIEIFNLGYKPYSSWYESMSKKFKYDKRTISQELECVHGDTLVTYKNEKTELSDTISIENLYNKLKDPLNNFKYSVLTPYGFVKFSGIQKLSKKTREIVFNNNKKIRGSLNHKILNTNNEWVFLSDIKIKDTFKTNLEFIEVVNIIDYDYESDVYDILNCGENNCYYTNDLISHNCDFLGSGDSVIDSKTIDNIVKNFIQEPVEKQMQGSIWIWKNPELNHRYILGCDVSRGDSEDFSSINIIDFDTQEQVLEYIGKIPPDDLATLVNKFGKIYGNAFVVVDITGGMGIATVRKLQEFNYKNLYVEGMTNNRWEYNSKINDKIPGINFNNKRTQIIASFEEHLRNGFNVRSSRLINELNTFVYINGRPDHMKGAHDDSIMSLAMSLFVGDICFSLLEKNDSINKAILNSWTLNETSYKPTLNNQELDYLQHLNSKDIYYKDNPMNVPMKAYEQYSWLFKKPKR